jgi:CubicO group peptidase (beta-lactamase class C family)
MASTTHLEPARLTALRAAAHADVRTGRVPACQFAVGHKGKVIVAETFGDAGPGTRFAARSITKALIASAVWLLLGEGPLDPAAPVGRYLPEFDADGREAVTVDHVLLHTAGLQDATMSRADGVDPDRRRRRFRTWRPVTTPGERYRYHSTSAGWVLADLIERLSGTDFRDFLYERVCEPLGLPRVLGVPPGEQDDIATVTWTGPGEWGGGTPELDRSMNDPDVRAAGLPASGALLTAADLARFYQALLHNPGGLWDPAVLADATGTIRCTLWDPIFGAPCNRSRGLVVAGDDGRHTRRYGAFGHTSSPAAFGHAGAHFQIAWADPATGLSFAYLTNGVIGSSAAEIDRGVRLSTHAASLLDPA